MTPITPDNDELRTQLAQIANRQYDKELTIAEAINAYIELFQSHHNKLLSDLVGELPDNIRKNQYRYE